PVPPSASPRRVGILAYDGLCLFEFGCAVELFALPRPELSDFYQTTVLALGPSPLRATAGVALLPVDADLGLLETLDMLVVPGWCDPETPPPEALLTGLRHLHRRGGRLVSFCSGAFVLAATGLLDGRLATTHWRYGEVIKGRFPRVRWATDVLYTDTDQLCTSAGSAAALDLGLHLIRRDFGPDVAHQVAKRLVVAPHRGGGQRQFVDRPLPRPGRLAATLDWALAQLHQPLTVAQLAHHARLSRRSFDRQFRAATGMSPQQWLVAQRLQRAVDYLETTTWSVETIAHAVGLNSAMSLRHHFRKHLQMAPQADRRRVAREGP
ncbi:MAG: helix-turn-helix domain-containing protein, partial [Candidatus Competibacterales bacterium]